MNKKNHFNNNNNQRNNNNYNNNNNNNQRNNSNKNSYNNSNNRNNSFNNYNNNNNNRNNHSFNNYNSNNNNFGNNRSHNFSNNNNNSNSYNFSSKSQQQQHQFGQSSFASIRPNVKSFSESSFSQITPSSAQFGKSNFSQSPFLTSNSNNTTSHTTANPYFQSATQGHSSTNSNSHRPSSSSGFSQFSSHNNTNAFSKSTSTFSSVGGSFSLDTINNHPHHSAIDYLSGKTTSSNHDMQQVWQQAQRVQDPFSMRRLKTSDRLSSSRTSGGDSAVDEMLRKKALEKQQELANGLFMDDLQTNSSQGSGSGMSGGNIQILTFEQQLEKMRERFFAQYDIDPKVVDDRVILNHFHKLSDDDVKAFESQTFHLFKIPEIAPPQEYCNNTN